LFACLGRGYEYSMTVVAREARDAVLAEVQPLGLTR
jgi:hypothetical protein